MAVAIPPGGTFFDTLEKSFVDVPIDESKDKAIPTTEFLAAAESLLTLFDVMGSAAFKPVKSDMSGNIKVGFGVEAEGEDVYSFIAENPRQAARSTRPIRDSPGACAQ